MANALRFAILGLLLALLIEPVIGAWGPAYGQTSGPLPTRPPAGFTPLPGEPQRPTAPLPLGASTLAPLSAQPTTVPVLPTAPAEPAAETPTRGTSPLQPPASTSTIEAAGATPIPIATAPIPNATEPIPIATAPDPPSPNPIVALVILLAAVCVATVGLLAFRRTRH
ncbi:MAG: hypothetical protein HW416_313 [Chloroflexi bacterium]|nr:hypothetical protein [Chloroflexota bacterium]